MIDFIIQLWNTLFHIILWIWIIIIFIYWLYLIISWYIISKLKDYATEKVIELWENKLNKLEWKIWNPYAKKFLWISKFIFKNEFLRWFIGDSLKEKIKKK